MSVRCPRGLSAASTFRREGFEMGDVGGAMMVGLVVCCLVAGAVGAGIGALVMWIAL